MQAALADIEDAKKNCRLTDWGYRWEASRRDLRNTVRTKCGVGAAPPKNEATWKAEQKLLGDAEQKLKVIAEEEQNDLEKGEEMPDVEGVEDKQELKEDTERLADGHVNGEKDLEAAQEVLAGMNLNSTKPKSKGGEGVPIVTTEDIRQVNGNALLQDPDSMPLQENVDSTDSQHRMVEGDMRVPKQAAALLQTRGIAAGETWPNGDVPYCFAKDVSSATKNAFLEAVEHYDNSPISRCINFHKVDPEDGNNAKCVGGKGLYVQSREPQACWADMGYLIGGNVINLGTGLPTAVPTNGSTILPAGVRTVLQPTTSTGTAPSPSSRLSPAVVLMQMRLWHCAAGGRTTKLTSCNPPCTASRTDVREPWRAILFFGLLAPMMHV